MHLFFYFTYNSSALVGSAFGDIWEDPAEGGFIKFAVKRALQQDQTVTLHMEGKLHVILYFRAVCYRTYVVHAQFIFEYIHQFNSQFSISYFSLIP